MHAAMMVAVSTPFHQLGIRLDCNDMRKSLGVVGPRGDKERRCSTLLGPIVFSEG